MADTNVQYLLEQLNRLRLQHDATADASQILPPGFRTEHANFHHHADELKRRIREHGEALAASGTSSAVLAIKAANDARRALAAAKVFAVPELLERVLLAGLSIKEVLTCMEVSTAFRDAVLGSITLRRYICLEADPTSHWRSAFDPDERDQAYPSLHVTLQITERVTLPNSRLAYSILANERSTVTADLGLARHGAPKLGSRRRDMLICQPPVKEVVVHPRCCYGRYTLLGLDAAQKGVVMSSETGITIGQLCDVVAALQADHAHCPLASDFQLREDGTVERMMIKAEATIAIPDTDEVVVGYKARDARYKELYEAEKVNSKWKKGFTAATAHAFEHGQPIPTLKEWRESQASTDDAT